MYFSGLLLFIRLSLSTPAYSRLLFIASFLLPFESKGWRGGLKNQRAASLLFSEKE
jgi:hypothetical protein